jgi:rod shape-determining protein MreD
MLVVYFIAAGLLLVILQTTICMPTPVWILAPDLYYVLVAYLAFRLDLLRSLLILFPLACLLDTLSGTILGMYVFLCLSGYFLLRFLSAKLPMNPVLYQIPLIGASYLAVSWLAYLLLNVFEPEQQMPWQWWKMIIRMLLVVVAAYPLFFLFDLIQKNSHRHVVPWNKLRLRTDNRRRQRSNH